MPWPYIFFKGGKKGTPAEPPPPPPAVDPAQKILAPTTASGPTVALPTGPQPPTIKPVPFAAAPQILTTQPMQSKVDTSNTGTRTLPAMHGVRLRPPARSTPSTGAVAIGAATPPPPRPTAPLKNIEQLMAEADPTHKSHQTGVVPPIKRQETEAVATPPPINESTLTPVTSAPIATKSSPMPSSPILPPPKPASLDPSLIPPPFPSFRPAPVTPEVRLSEPVKAVPAPVPVIVPAAPLPPPPPSAPSTLIASKVESPVVAAKVEEKETGDSPFILNPSVAPRPGTPIPQPPPPQIGSVFRRKASMADVARIVLPPRREETQPIQIPSSPSAVVPPAFPVAAMTVRASPPLVETRDTAKIVRPSISINAPSEVIAPESKAPAPGPIVDLPKLEISEPVLEKKSEEPVIETKPLAEDKVFVEEKPVIESTPVIETKAIVEEKPENKAPEVLPIPVTNGDVAEKSAPPETSVPPPFLPASSAPAAMSTTSLFPEVPKVDPEAHKPEPTVELPPKVDPEAHKPEPIVEPALKVDSDSPRLEPIVEPAPKVEPEAPKPEPTPVTAQAIPVAQVTVPEVATDKRERKEFHLTNGERIGGVVLSETPDIVLIEHPGLGVISVPRNQIAKRLVEIILINGDRIVGDVMAETSDTLYVRHASLGMLTVPRSQRSERVVEAILKDGDRILGEVLTETDSFTVIRSATLGTVTIPHAKLTMLNRKIEQIELKTLPPAAPELKDKPSS